MRCRWPAITDGVGISSETCWLASGVDNKPEIRRKTNDVTYSLEHKMLNNGVQEASCNPGVSRGKGQDLFLQAFYQSLQLIQQQKLKVSVMHAVVVGSDMNAQTKFETQLREFVVKSGIHACVHFVNKTLAMAPYLAAIDVLVQNSQARGECFGRIAVEAMAFKLPVVGTAAGGTIEIVVDGSTGLLHPAGKEGVAPLAKNIVRLASHAEQRVAMGNKGYDRVKERFMEHHMAERIAAVLKEVLKKTRKRSYS